jgi:hypothetical protein
MTTLATFWKTDEAHLFQRHLEAVGMKAFLQDENITQILPKRPPPLEECEYMLRIVTQRLDAILIPNLEETWSFSPGTRR